MTFKNKRLVLNSAWKNKLVARLYGHGTRVDAKHIGGLAPDIPLLYDYLDGQGFDTTHSLVGFPPETIAMGGYPFGAFLSTLDALAIQNRRTRLSRTVRIFPDITAGEDVSAFAHFYPNLLITLAEAAAASDPFDYTLVQTGASVNALDPAQAPRWLLAGVPQANDPDPTSFLAGRVFVICILAEAFPYYHSAVNAGPTATYLDDYALFTGRHARFDQFGGLVFHYTSTPLDENAVCALHLQHAINGTGGYPQALADYGWQYLAGAANEPLSTFVPYVKSFFGLS